MRSFSWGDLCAGIIAKLGIWPSFGVANRDRVGAIHKFFDFSQSGRARLRCIGLVNVLAAGVGLRFMGLPRESLGLCVELVDLSDLGLVFSVNVWVPLNFIGE
jgi:hypothetical protein